MAFKTKVNLLPYAIGFTSGGRTVVFRVVDSAGDLYRIVTNEETFQTCFINIDEYRKYNHAQMSDAGYKFIYKYETWLEYMQWSGRFIEKKNMVIYDKPNGNVLFENKKNDFLPFAVVDMDGDWIKLEKMNTYRNRYSDSVNYDGWTQWKDGEKLLIQILKFLKI